MENKKRKEKNKITTTTINISNLLCLTFNSLEVSFEED